MAADVVKLDSYLPDEEAKRKKDGKAITLDVRNNQMRLKSAANIVQRSHRSGICQASGGLQGDAGKKRCGFSSIRYSCCDQRLITCSYGGNEDSNHSTSDRFHYDTVVSQSLRLSFDIQRICCE